MVAFAVERCGGLDYAYLNAGIGTGGGIGEDFDLELYRRAMGVNLDGVVFGTHAVLRALKARGGGAIVATASLAGLTGDPMDPLYTANKHAVVGWTRAMGPILEGEGIRFNAVCPGYAESEIIAPFRDQLLAAGLDIIPAESVAETVVRLLGERRGRASAGSSSPTASRRPSPSAASPDQERISMDFELTDRAREFQERLRAFMDERVHPAEETYEQQIADAGDPHFHPPVMEELKEEARSRGLWNLFHPDPEYGARPDQRRVRDARRDHAAAATSAPEASTAPRRTRATWRC